MAGTSNYPESVDNFTPLADGVDVIQADDENNSYVAHNKTQTFIGSTGENQSKNTDLIAHLIKERSTMKLSIVDVNTIQVSAGVIVCKNASETKRLFRKNPTTTNVTFADLDTGARQLNKKYYVIAVADGSGSTVTFKLSLSRTAPTGITTFGVVGFLMTNGNGSGDIETVEQNEGADFAWNNDHLIFAQTVVQSGDTKTSNTTSEQEFQTQVVLPPDLFRFKGQVVKVTIIGEMHVSTGANTDHLFKLKFGSTVIWQTTWDATYKWNPSVGDTDNKIWMVEIYIICTTVGASGAVEAGGFIIVPRVSPNGYGVPAMAGKGKTAVVSGIDTTQPQTLKLTLQTGDASNYYTWTMRQLMVQRLN